MDLIYMNSAKEDIGVLSDYELDLAFGEDENDFECRVQKEAHCCNAGYYLYIENTEYGGIVDGIESNTGSGEVVYSGRTWHGILGSKIILPLKESETAETESGITQEGSTLTILSGVTVEQKVARLYITDGVARSGRVTIETVDSNGVSLVDRYLVISGSANDCIYFILERCGLTGLFEVDQENGGSQIVKFQFNRFTDAYSGLARMLKSAGLKMTLRFSGGKVIAAAAQRGASDELDSDHVDLTVKKKYHTINHLICLGTGELENRTIIHLYADEEGNISHEQTQFGMDEYTAIFEYPNAESVEELESSGIDNLKSLWEPAEISIDFDESSDAYDVGDVVGAVDHVTGIKVASGIAKKIVTIKNGRKTISYEVGD